MTERLAKQYARGTHRLVSPAETLARITPHLSEFGITRCAEVTGLDSIGIPVYVAIRPQGRILQTSNGKGLADVDARVSALMEGIEHWHAENARLPVRRASERELVALGCRVMSPRHVDGYLGGNRSRTNVIDWVNAEDLLSGEMVLVPAFAASYRRDQHDDFSFNGLASGNHVAEATLHAIYELIERHELAALSRRDTVRFERCRGIDLATVRDDAVQSLVERIARAHVTLVLMRLPSRTRTHTFIAVLLDAAAFANASAINFGFGAHLSPSVAAVRAITEAAQARLTFIHGSREDIPTSVYERSHGRLLEFFSQFPTSHRWRDLRDFASTNLGEDLRVALTDVKKLGFARACRVDLGQGLAGVAVAKVVLPGARKPTWL